MTAPWTAHVARLIAVVGPSGVGKDSLLHAWRERLGPDGPVHFAQRVVTRAPDPGGETHESLDLAAFDALRADGALAFTWRAHGLDYGVRHAELEPLTRGCWVVFNASRAHLTRLPCGATGMKIIEVTAPRRVLQERLRRRGRETDEALAKRLARTVAPVHADLVLVNDDEQPLAEVADRLHREWTSWAQAAPSDQRNAPGATSATGATG